MTPTSAAEAQRASWTEAGGRAVLADWHIEPIRGEMFGPDRLAEHARRLAHSHRLATVDSRRHRGRGPGLLLAQLEATERTLAEVRETLTDATRRGLDISPAGAWLLDNFFVVLDQVREIRANLPRGYYHELPKLAGTGSLAGYPRIYEIAIELIAHTDGRLDAPNVALMVREYQSVVSLTMGELWATPAMLRIAFLENIRRMALRTAQDVDDTAQADRWVTRFRDAAARAHGSGPAAQSALARALAEFVYRPPAITPAFLTRFLQQIRSRRVDFTPLLWLEQWIAEDVMSVEEAVQRSMEHLALTQLVMANSIVSLRTVASVDWRAFVETESACEAVLRRDPAGVYAGMTFETRDRYRHVVEGIAKRTGVPEPTVAAAAVAAAAAASANGGPPGGNKGGAPDRRTHVGYYLVDEGRRQLERTLQYRPHPGERVQRSALRHPNLVYFGAVVAATVIALGVLLTPLDGNVSFGWLIAAGCLALGPGIDAAIAVVNQLVMFLVPPSRLPRLDYSAGVPAPDRTVVVIPLLFGSVDAVTDALDHLEAQHLANSDPEVRFALLGDFLDSDNGSAAGDEEIVDAAVTGLRALNDKYRAPVVVGGPPDASDVGTGSDGAGAPRAPFYLFQRPRRWNAAEGAWIGWERKRGKLSDFNAYLRGDQRNAFSVAEGDLFWLEGVRYVITLDADTVLPLGAAAALIGTIAHPLNRAEYDPAHGRVVRGYGILQPRVSVSLESANGSRFAAVFAGHPGVDPYTTAVSDVYQDLFGEGTFTGKGIYDVDMFERATRGRFPENTLLSHDLIEGAFARAGLATDIEVFDDYPKRYLTATLRLHRWVRGDWQLLPWLAPRVPDGNAASDSGAGPARRTTNPLSGISRWKIADNIRRSLVPIATFAFILAGWTVLPGSASAWTTAALAALATPWIAALLLAVLRPPPGQSWRPYYAAVWHDARSALAQFALATVFLPHQALIAGDAVVRTVTRVFRTHRHMLEWQTASQVERVTATTRPAIWQRVGPAVALASLSAFVGAWHQTTIHQAGATAPWLPMLVLGLLWIAAPEVAFALSSPLPRPDLALSTSERAAALRYALQHWRFVERFAGPDTNWLVPDNFQETPEPVVALRTSPTNIGLQLLATLSAYDLGFITRAEMLDRLEHALDALGRMRRLRGHFFNWYDLSDLRVLDPPYISTVDSGNLAGHLIALAEGCLELVDAPGPDGHGGDLQSAVVAAEIPRLESLAHRAREMAMAMDFRLLYHDRGKLMAIGFDERSGRLDGSSYDLLASEARLASFFAVAKGDVPVEHWFHLGRSLTTAHGATALVSWSGSMFEYLMPLLVMPSRPSSLLDQTHHGAVRRQVAYARRKGIPWGISESAYNLRDQHETYQYRAFGVPGLALKRGLANDLVVAPYASALAMAVDPHGALRNLAVLERQGAFATYGFYDAVDYTRPEPDQPRAVVRTFMAHHVGMTLVALDNALQVSRGEGVWQRRFMSDPVVRAAALLLDERVPRRYVSQPPQSDTPDDVPERPEGVQAVVREYDTPDTPAPRVGLLGGPSYSLLVTNAGGGYSRANGMAVMRWRADATRDDTGHWVYVKDVSKGQVWSATHQPTGAPATSYRVTFAIDRVVFSRRDGAIDTRTQVAVVPREQTEIRRVTLTNRSRATRDVELTSYGEIVLTDPDADRAHPAFQNLFVETEWVPGCAAVLASRRPRSAGERRPWCAHIVATGPERVGDVSCETDRARFIGRGRTTRAPRALDDGATLSCTVGSVLDPIVALRVRVRLEPGRSATVAFTTVVADDRETVLAFADRYRDLRASERALALSTTGAQIELRDFDVTPPEAALYQELAGALIYPLEELRASEAERAANARGQGTLWAHGISGDWPIVLATIREEVGLPSVRQLLVAHKYWRMKGVTSDLVILNARGPSYMQELQDQLVAMVVSSTEGGLMEKAGGVFIRRSDAMPADVVRLIRATARINVVCDGVGLGGIVESAVVARWSPPVGGEGSARRAGRQEHARPVPPAIAAPSRLLAAAAPVPKDRPDHAFANGVGRLTSHTDYEIVVDGAAVPPAPWANIVANPRVGFCVTERGGGFAWAENSLFFRLTPWYNDPVSDPSGEALFIQDAESGLAWTPTPGPALARDGGLGDTRYVVRHAPGVSVFQHERDAIASELVLAVPESDPVKISRLRLTNRGTRARRLTLTSFVEWTLGAQREHTRHQVHTRLDHETGAIFAQNVFMEDFASRVAFSWMSETITSRTGDRDEFIGRNGTVSEPAALGHDRLSGTTGAGYDPCAALRATIALAPGESRDVVVLLGAARDANEARAVIERNGTPPKSAAAADPARGAWDARLSVITARTPSPEFDAMLNRWALYQALSCRMWARSALYQSSGAYGFRDQLQDSMAFVYAEPAVARTHILRAAGRQFAEGDVQHWWHEPSGRGVRTRFADDLVWLPFVADHYVRVTGDTAVWDEHSPYLAMRALAPDEHEAYELPTLSGESGTLYEHCVRALDHACTSGVHGLPLFGSGDWNDGMNRVGVGGTGESVWLAWFLTATLRRFADHCAARGDAGAADRFRTRADSYAAAVEREAWDGAWYRRAYYDDGTPLGSASNHECQIDAIAQSWAVLSGAGNPARARQAMAAVVERLVREDARLIMLLTPPFDGTSHDPGYIKGYVPGVRENGAQYTHAALWTALAAVGLGDGDLAFHLLDMLNPLTHAATPEGVETYKVEPYVVCADVYTAEGHLGRGGWTWYTGSASWSYRVALEGVLGFVKRGDRLTIDPCVPSAWTEFGITYRYGVTTYTMTVLNRDGVSRGVVRVAVDGRTAPEGVIDLADDGAPHEVVVTMGKGDNR